MIMHHCKNHRWLDVSWGCLPSPFPKRHTEISQAANDRQGDGCRCCPKCLGILRWECVPRREVSPSRPVSICHRGRNGWGESSLRAEQKRVSFLLPNTYQHKSKASSVPKRQNMFTPELSVPPPQCWEPLLPAPSEAGCFFPKPCIFLQECPLYPFSLLPSLLSFLTMIPLDPSEAALKWNSRGCFGFVLILGAQTQKQVSPIHIPGMQLVLLLPLAEVETSVSIRHWKGKSESQLHACVPALLNPHPPQD